MFSRHAGSTGPTKAPKMQVHNQRVWLVVFHVIVPRKTAGLEWADSSASLGHQATRFLVTVMSHSTTYQQHVQIPTQRGQVHKLSPRAQGKLVPFRRADMTHTSAPTSFGRKQPMVLLSLEDGCGVGSGGGHISAHFQLGLATTGRDGFLGQ